MTTRPTPSAVLAAIGSLDHATVDDLRERCLGWTPVGERGRDVLRRVDGGLVPARSYYPGASSTERRYLAAVLSKLEADGLVAREWCRLSPQPNGRDAGMEWCWELTSKRPAARGAR